MGYKERGRLGDDDRVGRIEHAYIACCKRGHNLTQRGLRGQCEKFIAPDDEVGGREVADIPDVSRCMPKVAESGSHA